MTPPESPAEPAAEPVSRRDFEHLHWPPERFYWALLDGSAISRHLSGRRQREQLGYLFENVLPGVAIEDLQTTYVPVEGGRGAQKFVACGMEIVTVRQEAMLEEGATPLTLTPASLPSFIGDLQHNRFDTERLNLLTGDLEPEVVGRERRRTHALLSVMLALIGGLVTIGWQRRISHVEEQFATLQDLEQEVIRQVLGPSATPSGQPMQLRLVAELRQLQQTRRPLRTRQEQSLNIVDDFAQLMKVWPATEDGVGLFVQTESIVLTDQSISIRGRVPTMADVQNLADNLTLDDWTLQQPQSTLVTDPVTRSSAVDLSLRLDRKTPTESSTGAP